MGCNNCQGNCQCSRRNAVNIFSKDFAAGVKIGQQEESTRTAHALIELERAQVISNAQMQAILDLILEKLTDFMDVD